MPQGVGPDPSIGKDEWFAEAIEPRVHGRKESVRRLIRSLRMSARKQLTLIAAILATVGIGIPVASYAESSVAAAQVVTVAPLAIAKPPGKPAPDPLGSAKLTITSLEGTDKLVAQYNPKEVKVDKTVLWSKTKTSTGDRPELEFTSAEGRTMSFELFFDTYEAGTDVEGLYVSKLLALAMVMDTNGAEDKKRPPRVKVQWGTGDLHFDGVIESVSVKYTMFLPAGTPVRATCTVKLKEASRASFKRK
jgi:Contractile injection system tube protein